MVRCGPIAAPARAAAEAMAALVGRHLRRCGGRPCFHRPRWDEWPKLQTLPGKLPGRLRRHPVNRRGLDELRAAGLQVHRANLVAQHHAVSHQPRASQGHRPGAVLG